MHATKFGDESAKLEKFGFQLILDQDEGGIVNLRARFGQLGLEMDDIFAKVEILSEQARDFALEGADAQALGRVVPERQLVRIGNSRRFISETHTLRVRGFVVRSGALLGRVSMVDTKDDSKVLIQ